MKYGAENIMFWNRLRAAAKDLGMDLNALNNCLCLADGTLEVMEEYGFEPDGELLARLKRFFGISGRTLLTGEAGTAPLQTPRNVFVYRSGKKDLPFQNIENLVGTVVIDRPSWDDREYVGFIVKDDSMRDALIHRGDMVIIRRQAIAADNCIVAAEVDGSAVIRRIHRMKDVFWLEAEGPMDDGEMVVSENLNATDRHVRIWGQVISATRLFEENDPNAESPFGEENIKATPHKDRK